MRVVVCVCVSLCVCCVCMRVPWCVSVCDCVWLGGCVLVHAQSVYMCMRVHVRAIMCLHVIVCV